MTSKSHRRLQFAATAAASIALAFAAAAPIASAQGMVAGMGSSRSVTESVTVKSVDAATRHVVVTGASGDTFSLKAPPAVRNFDRIKPGDKIKATYTIETEYVVSSPNTPLPSNTETLVAARAAKGEVPAGVVANHIVVTGNVLAIDTTKHTLRMVDRNGGRVHTIYVRDPDRQRMMGQVKVGDTITAYVTESLLIAVNPA